MRVLVTGGAGFIGSHYVRTMLSGGYRGFGDARVTVLDKLTYAGNLANLGPVSGCGRLEFVRGDICDEGLLAGVVPGHDLVVNFAAETHVDRSIAGAGAFVAANVAGCQGLMDACLTAGGPRGGAVAPAEGGGGGGVVGGGCAVVAEFAVCGGEGGRGFDGAGLCADAWAERERHTVL